MPPGQAFVIASVIVLAVFGFLYIAWRSTATDRTASYLRTAMSVVSASMSAGVGTFFLLLGEPNIQIAVGVGIAVFASAFKTGFMVWHRHHGGALSHGTIRTMLRFSLGGNLVAGSLCGIGCMIYGGAVGVLGACLSACWALLHFWVLRHVIREATVGRKKPRPLGTSRR
jgi:hypothetical protein